MSDTETINVDLTHHEISSIFLAMGMSFEMMKKANHVRGLSEVFDSFSDKVGVTAERRDDHPFGTYAAAAVAGMSRAMVRLGVLTDGDVQDTIDKVKKAQRNSSPKSSGWRKRMSE